jgi:hypothetical protein
VRTVASAACGELISSYGMMRRAKKAPARFATRIER